MNPQASAPDRVSEAARAKINLFLHVGEKRQDGFHALQSLAVFTDAGDGLRVAAAAQLDLVIQGPFASGLTDQADNLVLRAARALAAQTGIAPGGLAKGAALRLEKNLPVASGVGGGSADAAAALRALTRLWQMNLDPSALLEIAAALGSDIPVCVASVPAFMEGRGEILRPVAAMPRLNLLLVNPGVTVSTGPVFAALTARRGTAMALPANGFDDCAELLRFLDTTANDLEAPACLLQPAIGEVLAALAALPGALFRRMSGSGATCFAIFPDQDSCARAAAALRQAAPGWWVVPTLVPRRGEGKKEPQPQQDIGPRPDGL